MEITRAVILLFLLVGVLLYTTAYYWRTADFTRYAAGKAFMTLLVSLDLLVVYSAFARFFPLEPRRTVFEILIGLLILAVLYIQAVMRHERKKERKRQRARYFEPQPLKPSDIEPGDSHHDEH
jgi:glucose uptake protein GlcU